MNDLVLVPASVLKDLIDLMVENKEVNKRFFMSQENKARKSGNISDISWSSAATAGTAGGFGGASAEAVQFQQSLDSNNNVWYLSKNADLDDFLSSPDDFTSPLVKFARLEEMRFVFSTFCCKFCVKVR